MAIYKTWRDYRFIREINGIYKTNFKFNLIIRDLKNFTNLISELKQRDFKFKIIRHDNKKKNAFKQKILKYFKKN